MFGYIRKRALVAGVAAELKAQCKDQELVKQVCFTPAGMHTILELGNGRFQKKGKLRYFMITTFLLADTLRTDDIPLNVKRACFELLSQRREKITRHMDGVYGPVLIHQDDVDDLDEVTDLGVQVFHSERRSFLMDQITRNTGMNL
ncbi:hypothetical protein ACJ7V3_18460 [Halomonas elongata]|uniref:hypothetical protein n=1 Tax=Halomonas elongata TaxID=2746 RepID=UPI0038D43D9A